MNKPSLGRIVLVHLTDELRTKLRDARGNDGPVVPAVIVRVWSDSCVNVQLLPDGPAGSVGWLTSVMQAPPEEIDPITGLPTAPYRWVWPPREPTTVPVQL